MTNTTEWVTFVLGAISITTAVAGGVKWLVKHYLAELKPNGGGSLRDQVNRIADDNGKLNEKLDRMYDILLEHVSKH